jgi:hypothetical protein
MSDEIAGGVRRQDPDALMKVLLDLFHSDHLAVPGATLESYDAVDGTMQLASSVEAGREEGSSDDGGSAYNSARESDGGGHGSDADGSLQPINLDEWNASPKSPQDYTAVGRAQRAAAARAREEEERQQDGDLFQSPSPPRLPTGGKQTPHGKGRHKQGRADEVAPDPCRTARSIKRPKVENAATRGNGGTHETRSKLII